MYWRAAILCLSLVACANLAACTTPRTPPAPPTDAVIAAATRIVFAETKLPGTPEVSRIRPAHPVSPGDWIICMKSSVPTEQRRYAIFLTTELVASHLSVQVDGCEAETYAPAPK